MLESVLAPLYAPAPVPDRLKEQCATRSPDASKVPTT
jgi:hypothetical protein